MAERYPRLDSLAKQFMEKFDNIQFDYFAVSKNDGNHDTTNNSFPPLNSCAFNIFFLKAQQLWNKFFVLCKFIWTPNEQTLKAIEVVWILTKKETDSESQISNDSYEKKNAGSLESMVDSIHMLSEVKGEKIEVDPIRRPQSNISVQSSADGYESTTQSTSDDESNDAIVWVDSCLTFENENDFDFEI
ncbi:hypothetical protein AB6A40_006807 [Gnathostoma spinigerum]|uniref:Uncharacterized protein n=1 Tax=Gnathostoma spinigerum TaxID=75299 RepID=A0ABD6ESU2_9BILA